jgi:DNA-binding NtrC family response regulator
VTRLGGRLTIDCDFRLVCATNRDLAREVREGRFREDLFYRVAVFPIRLPPLRERPEDLDLLLATFFREEGLEPPRIADDALALLRLYPWPGNVRELKNFAQAASVIAEGRVIDERVARAYFGGRLENALAAPKSPGSSAQSAFPALSGGLMTSDDASRPIRRLDVLEREEISRALRHYQGNVPEAARALGMGRATLYKYIKRHGLDPLTGEFRAEGAGGAARVGAGSYMEDEDDSEE